MVGAVQLWGFMDIEESGRFLIWRQTVYANVYDQSNAVLLFRDFFVCLNENPLESRLVSAQGKTFKHAGGGPENL